MIVPPGFPKTREGRSEPIIEPEIPIVDSHHHLFHRPTLRYMLDEYLEDAKLGHNIVATVYVETQSMASKYGPENMRAIGEVEFALGVGAIADSGTYGPCRVGAAMVGFADMTTGEHIAPYLDRAVTIASQRFRGVRQIALSHSNPSVLNALTHVPPADLLASSHFRPALHELEKRSLSFDATVLHTQLPQLAAIVGQSPNNTFVLDHMGLAIAHGATQAERDEAFDVWRTNIREIAQHPNIYCKVGGLGTSYWKFPFYMSLEPVGYEALARMWKPYVETVIDAFGFERCMAESNFPNDGRSCGFVPLWNALKWIVKDCSRDEKNALFHGTAIKVYRICGVELSP